MSDTTNTVTSVNLEQKAIEIINKVQELAVQMAPEAWELTLSAVQAQGIANICLGVALLIITVLLMTGSYKSSRKDMSNMTSDGVGASFSFSVATGLLSIPFAIATLAHLLDTSSWIAAFYPEAAIALRLIGS